MVVTILLVLIGVFLAISAIILLAPVIVSCSGSVNKDSVSAEVLGWWLHPKAVKCVVDIRKKAVSVFAFGSFRIFSSLARESPEGKKTVTLPADLAEDEKPGSQKQKRQEKASFTSQEQPHQTPEEHEKTPEEQMRDDAEIEKPSFSEKLNPLKKVLVFLKDPSFRAKIFRLLARTVHAVFRTVSLKKFTVRIKAGLFDPSLTGAAYGYYIGFKNMISTEKSSRAEILFEPVFNDEPFSAEGGIEISSSIARLCLPVVFAVLTFPYLHAYILYRRAKKIGQK
jgi:hypothetical protein